MNPVALRMAWRRTKHVLSCVGLITLGLLLTASTTSAQDIMFDMVSNGGGAIQGVHGYDVTEAPTEYGAYSADWYRDVLGSASPSILQLSGGMQQAGGWYFVLCERDGPDVLPRDNCWVSDHVDQVAGNLFDIRFTEEGGRSVDAGDVPFEIWRLGTSADDTSDDVRLIPDGDFSFVLPDGGEHPLSAGIAFYLPADRTPGDAGYRQFVQDEMMNPEDSALDYGATRLVWGLSLMNWGRHQNESQPGAGDGPVSAQPETGTIFRLRSRDTLGPICKLSGFDASGTITMSAKVFDGGNGLKTIRVVDDGDMEIEIPTFDIGSTDSVTVTAVQTSAAGITTPVMEVEDAAGNRRDCTFFGTGPGRLPGADVPVRHDLRAAIHTMGNIVLALQSTSQLALTGPDFEHIYLRDFPLHGYWPKQGGANHIFGGGPWLAADEAVTQTWQWQHGQPYEEEDRYRWIDAPGWGITAGMSESADQEIRIRYDSESGAIRVTQTTFQWSDPARDDFIVFAYTIENRGTTPIAEVVPGLWLDPDVGDDYPNYVGFDSESGIVYALSEDSTTYVGVQVLGGATLSALAYCNGCFDQFGSNTYTTREKVWNALRAGFLEMPTNLVDYRLLVSTGPFPLEAGEKHTVSFGLVMSESLEALKANAATMEQVYQTIPVAGDHTTEGFPVTFGLAQNYPNPFNPTTTISYDLPRLSAATLTVYDVLGRQVRELASGTKPAGTYEMSFDADGIPSGIYFYRLEAGDYVETKRMVIVR